VTDIHIAIDRDRVRTDINLAVRHWFSNTVLVLQWWVNRFRFPSRTNQPTPVFAASLHYYLQVLSAVKAVCADDWVG
jgi:hypothetical protein